MTGYLIRRVLQMILVLLASAIISYGLLNLAPGGPTAGLAQQAANARFRLTEEDIARIRATFELDLNLPIRFLRWFAGFPRGPLQIGNQTFFGNVQVGCRITIEALVRDAKGNVSTRVIGCKQPVFLKDMVGRRTSRGVLFGDFGLSWKLLRDRPVSYLISSRVWKTVQLAGLSSIIALLVGIPIGIYSAVKQYSRFDYFFTGLAFIGSAMPTFFFGILMILFLSVLPKLAGLPFLPSGSAEAVRAYTIPGFGTIEGGSFIDRLLHLIMPVAVLAIVSISGWSRYIRTSMLEVMRQDYIRTARSKGLIERLVILKHGVRNALIPFITLLVFILPGLFGGAIITETVFSWPGMGRLYFTALNEYDYPVALAILFISAVLIVIATLVRDILYTWVDPRIRLS
ncbi:MAG: ABC transporter permease [Anaerolineaceae bacterium]|nr:ABC transporter permease [Anaerolineaceae bacterium]